jgi:broad specificity phosphatase PhoE
MRLFIIRHAQSTNNALDDPRGRVSDPALTSLGRRQAQVLAEHVRSHADDYAIAHLLVSPMWRALETSRPLADALDLRPQVWVDLHEWGGIYLDHGEQGGVVGYPGKTRDELQRAFPDYEFAPEITEAGWWDPQAGREHRSGCMARAVRLLERLRHTFDDQETLALVTHGGFIDALVKAILNLLPGEHVYFHQKNTGITCFDLRTPTGADVRCFNRTTHLPPELMT